MIPIKLNLSGFLSYREPVEIDFTQFNLACISGSNGSGKSSLLDAITWSLFGQARARDDAVINMKSETAEVSLVFHYEGNQYRVTRAKTRDKTTVLEFHIQGADGKWKPLTERTMRGTEAIISEILRLDYETFVNASFFLQGKADQFTQQRPADRKRILGTILGLEVWEEYRKAAFERRKAVEQDITALDGRMQEVNAELAEEEERIARLKEIRETVEARKATLNTQTKLVEELRKQKARLEERKQLVEKLSEQAARTVGEAEKLQARLESRQEEKDAFADLMDREAEIEEQYQEWEKTRAELAEWEQTAVRFNEQEKQRNEPRTEIEKTRTRLETERDNLLKEKTTLDAKREQIEASRTALKHFEAETAQLTKALEERDALQEQHQKVLQEQTKAKAENPLLKAEMDDLKGRIEQLTSIDGAVCPLCGQPLSPEERTRLIEELNQEGTIKGDRYRTNLNLLKTVTEKVEELTLALAEYETVDEKQHETTRQLDQTKSQIGAFEQDETQWQAEGAPRLEEIQEQLKQENFAPEARATLAEIDKELKEIGYDAASHDAVRKKEEELRTAEAEHRQLGNARSALKPLEREIKELGEQIAEVEKTRQKQEQEHADAAAQLAAEEAEAPDLHSEERKMLDLQEEVNRTERELGAARQKVDVLEDQKVRKVELEEEREQLSKQVIEYKVLERTFGKNGVPAMLIEQALPQIETTANQILERLSAGGMSIRFITQQAYKDSKRDDMRETLDIQISDSAGIRDYEMYSGGEAFRINFSIRLALSEVLAQRAGARLQTLVIDEGFGSQDEIGRQRLIEAINTIQEDFEKILVITHIDALKEAFPVRLEVTKGPNGSVVDMA
ncbi:MAG: SMC family ATPase [Anaerolineales bacterium]|jgi:exonuclease SbcC